jgi:nucleoside phosphorylase
MNLLCVSAFEPELTRFRELAPSWIATAPVGIGLVDAAIGTAELLARHSPAELVFLGTCGSARSDLAIGDVVFATSVSLFAGPGSELVGESDIVVPMEQKLRDALVAAGATPATVATTVGITVSNELASDVAATGDVEHLEAYAFVRACARANVPCAVVLGVANVVGAKGRAEWRANHVRASKNAAESLVEAFALSRTSTTTP